MSRRNQAEVFRREYKRSMNYELWIMNWEIKLRIENGELRRKISGDEGDKGDGLMVNSELIMGCSQD
jgi:hypothetical protein